MEAKKPIGAGEALDKLLQIIREEANSNPRFERRLLEAVGYQVFYRGEETLAGNRENTFDAVDRELVDEDLAAVAHERTSVRAGWGRRSADDLHVPERSWIEP